MSSEKPCYLNKKCSPSAPLNFADLKTKLLSFGIKRLVDILWIRAQRDTVLNKVLMVSVGIPLAVVSVGIPLAEGSLEKAKAAIDYTLYFPDYIRYNDHGYGIILDEIRVTLECLEDKIHKEFVLGIAEYAFERGQIVSQNFEDDWDWNSSLEDLENWIKEIKANL